MDEKGPKPTDLIIKQDEWRGVLECHFGFSDVFARAFLKELQRTGNRGLELPDVPNARSIISMVNLRLKNMGIQLVALPKDSFVKAPQSVRYCLGRVKK